MVVRCEGHSSTEVSVSKDLCNNQRRDSSSTRRLHGHLDSPICHSHSVWPDYFKYSSDKNYFLLKFQYFCNDYIQGNNTND